MSSSQPIDDTHYNVAPPSIGRPGDQEVANAKDALLRQIAHYAREVDYDYPPPVLAASLRMVQTSHRVYKQAWQRRDAQSRPER